MSNASQEAPINTGVSQAGATPTVPMPPPVTPPVTTTPSMPTSQATPSFPDLGGTNAQESDVPRSRLTSHQSLDLNRLARFTPTPRITPSGYYRGSTSTDPPDHLDETFLIRNYDRLTERLRSLRDAGVVGDVARVLAFDEDVDEEIQLETTAGQPTGNTARGPYGE